MKLYQIFGNETTFHKYGGVDKTLFGIECEIESFRDLSADVGNYFKVTEDGSLRNEGKEFVSVPMFSKDIMTAFKKLHDNYRTHHWPKFSERTSIHVHVNCHTMEDTEVLQAILLYALYEEMFFRMCDPGRRNNIHCVALTETFLPAHYNSNLKFLYSKWHKYTALNIKPLSTYGTIEFRHMHGHEDTLLLSEWLTIIDRLMQLAKTSPLSPATLTKPNVLQWGKELFADTRLDGTDILPIIKNSLLDVKLGMI